MSPQIEPEVVWLPGEMRHEIHATGEDTDGAFCLFVDFPPAGWSLPRHRHLNEAETIHILEGVFDMEIEGEGRRVLEPGDTIRIPAGVPHSGGNIGSDPGKRVVVFAPAGPENFFREIGASTPGEPVDMDVAIAAAARYGFVLVEEEAGERAP